MSLRDTVRKAYDQYLDAPAVTRHLTERHASVGGVAREEVGTLAQHFELQQALRPLFGKPAATVLPTIGHHPDFEHLKHSRAVEMAPITTLFLDMMGSTKLGLVRPLEQVFRIKNAVIQATMDVIRAFDGHVHRIMGDAVMAYFGRKGAPPERGAIDALNCAATLRALIGDLIATRIATGDADEHGIRIGLDHGAAHKVLWSAYGYPGMEEVTATSFHVDVASKLQHRAGRNQIMIGAALRDLLDIPDTLLAPKTVLRDGELHEVPFVEPNYTLPDGRPTNYRQYLFDGDEYIRCTRLGPILAERDVDVVVDIGETDACDEALPVTPYAPGGRMLAKDRHLKFDVSIRFQPRTPFEVRFKVENHGIEATQASSLVRHGARVITAPGRLSLVHWESTSYRGLHYLEVQLVASGPQRQPLRLGVWIE